MADRVKALWDLASTPFVNPPIVRPETYRLPIKVRGQGSYVLFVNPRPEKGIEIACALAAARPDIPFVFVKSWSLTSKQDASMRERLSKLPNVRLLPSSDDVRPLYSGARLVLAPSANQWGLFIEAWGRIASEAQLSGIPVLASSGHGFDESVGPGGILVPANAPIKDWLNALSVLWDDQNAYSRCSRAAINYSARDELKPERVTHRFIAYLNQPHEVGS
jgi:glycosyltransferase involved in cell wall biosynthesis